MIVIQKDRDEAALATRLERGAVDWPQLAVISNLEIRRAQIANRPVFAIGDDGVEANWSRRGRRRVRCQCRAKAQPHIKRWGAGLPAFAKLRRGRAKVRGLRANDGGQAGCEQNREYRGGTFQRPMIVIFPAVPVCCTRSNSTSALR